MSRQNNTEFVLNEFLKEKPQLEVWIEKVRYMQSSSSVTEVYVVKMAVTHNTEFEARKFCEENNLKILRTEKRDLL